MTILTSPWVLFRCDASPTLGLGHLIRCRALAYAFKQAGTRCVMIGPSLDYRLPIDLEIFDEWIPKLYWDSSQEDATYLISCATTYSSQSIVIMDDYRVDESYQQILLMAGLRWLQFDSTASMPLWADWILNASPAACQEDYAKLLQKPNALALVGPEYAVLRPEFSVMPSRIREKSDFINVLVTFGGGDDRGAILFTLNSLLPVAPDKVYFHVISGYHNPNNMEIKRWIQSLTSGRVVLHINPVQMASIFLDCDIAVMAGGTTTFEAAACGLPMILITIAENQVDQAQAWHDLGVAVYLGRFSDLSADKLIHEFSKFLDVAWGQHVCSHSRLRVDGKGAERIVSILLRSKRETNDDYDST